MNIEYIEATTIPDAWFQAVSRIIDRGFKYEIQHGSFVGQTRLEFDFITIYIKHPYAEPYDLMLPQIPTHLGIPNPVEGGYVEQYMPYLMTGEKKEGEDYCYDSKTEILTIAGWKQFRDLLPIDLVATLNQITHSIEYQNIKKVHVMHYNGEMFHFKTKQIDCMVSPNHTMYIRKDKNSSFEVKKAKDINYTRFFLKKDGVWEGKEKKYFKLPAVEYNNPRYKYFGAERKILMDDWLEFFGTWLADGSLRKYENRNQYQIVITKYEKPEWCEKILNNIFNSVNYHKKDFVVADKQIYSYLEKFGLAGDKYIPKEILGLSSRQLKILFNAMYNCDGTKNENRDFYVYSTKSKRLVNNVQELCLKIGLCCNINKDSGVYRAHIGAVGTKFMNNTNPGITKNQISKIPYNGDIFCVEVEKNHILYVRRNGKPCWSGNTYGERLCKYYSWSNSWMAEVYGNQIDHWTRILKETPNTNQAVLQVAQPEDCELTDPPCLRHIDMRIKRMYGSLGAYDDFLIFYPYFRSWDLWGGLPANLAGIAVLQKYMADEIGVLSGPIIASSKGLHIYGYVEELAKLRVGK